MEKSNTSEKLRGKFVCPEQVASLIANELRLALFTRIGARALNEEEHFADQDVNELILDAPPVPFTSTIAICEANLRYSSGRSEKQIGGNNDNFHLINSIQIDE